MDKRSTTYCILNRRGKLVATFTSWIDTSLYLDRPEHHGYEWRDEPDLEVIIIQTISLPRIDDKRE